MPSGSSSEDSEDSDAPPSPPSPTSPETAQPRMLHTEGPRVHALYYIYYLGGQWLHPVLRHHQPGPPGARHEYWPGFSRRAPSLHLTHMLYDHNGIHVEGTPQMPDHDSSSDDELASDEEVG